MNRDIIETSIEAYNKLVKIISPINFTKLTYKEKKLFLDNSGFNKAWVEIKKIIEAHQYIKIHILEKDYNE